MTQEEKTVRAMLLAGEEDKEELFALYVSLAGEMILGRLYPAQRPADAAVPGAYELLQCELAAELFLWRGDEGEVIHIENGIHRHYESAASDELLKAVTPYAGVIA